MAKEFHDLNDYEDILEQIEGWFRLRGLFGSVKYKVIGDLKMNDFIQVKFTPDYVQHLYSCDVVIIVNPQIFEELFLDYETMVVLMNEALDIIGFIDNKVVKLKYDYTTTIEYQKKVGAEALIKAKEIKKLKIESFKEQQKKNK